MATAPLAVYQAEWCPHSAKVRQKLTELGIAFVAIPVPAERSDREAMREATGTDAIPAVVFDDGTVLGGESDDIVSALGERFPEGEDAVAHRRRAAEHGAT